MKTKLLLLFIILFASIITPSSIAFAVNDTPHITYKNITPKRETSMKQIIQTKNAPAAIGTYSQAVKIGNQIYISGQIPLDPQTMVMVEDNIDAEIRRVFDNLAAVLTAAGGNFSDVVKLNVYLTDLSNFSRINEIMAQYFTAPYPARAAIQVSALPKGARVEIDAVAVLQESE